MVFVRSLKIRNREFIKVLNGLIKLWIHLMFFLVLFSERRGSDGSRPGSRRRRRKSMRRRSSGGPDVLLSTGQSMDSFLAHRRGSLPVEILATSFSGEYYKWISKKTILRFKKIPILCWK